MIPRYFTLLVGCSFCPLSLKLRFFVKIFLDDLNMINSVFEVFRLILLARSQWTKSARSRLTFLLSSFIDLSQHTRLVSSAK